MTYKRLIKEDLLTFLTTGKELGGAFEWSKTQQGYNFWDHIYRGHAEVSESILADIWIGTGMLPASLEMFEAPYTCLHILNSGNVSDLAGAFVWDYTPFGHGHWRDIEQGKKKMTAYDRGFLRAIVRREGIESVTTTATPEVKEENIAVLKSTPKLSPADQAVLDMLKAKGEVTNVLANAVLKCRSVSRRITTLIRAGVPITKEMKKDHQGQRFVVYRLAA